MGMTPEEYLESFVEGNRSDCHDDPGCVRRAFNAAVSASHLADHFFTFNKRHAPEIVSAFNSIGTYVEHLSLKTNGAFRDIRSIANAYKHLYTDSESSLDSYSTVNSSGAIDSIEINDSDLTRVQEEYEENRRLVTFAKKDGSIFEFLPVLDAVVDYWHTEIYFGES